MSKMSRSKGQRGEEWRRIGINDGMFLGRYEVSSLGQVRANPIGKQQGSKPLRILFQSTDGKGYSQVSLHYAAGKKMTVKVHRLVADAFIRPRGDGETVNHIDGNKENNGLQNLEYVSNRDNSRHAFRVIETRSAVVVFGERMSVPEAVERFGHPTVDAQCAQRRVRRYGWSIEDAITTPKQPTGRPSRQTLAARAGKQKEGATV